METENSSVVDTQLQACQQELERWKDLYMRLNADMENMKRRMHKEQDTQENRVMTDILSNLLPVIDNFDRALQASHTYPTNDPLLQGLILIRKEFAQILEQYKVREMTEVQVFDPELHEAVSQMATDGSVASGAILTVLEKGYWYKDQVLRHAKVSVAL